MDQSTEFKIRYAKQSDIPEIKKLIQELAEFEKLGDSVTASLVGLDQSLFGPKKSAEVLIAEEGKTLVGFALFFQSYSTFLGKPGIYLEDLFIRPDFRGKGYGKTLLMELASIAHQRGAGRFEWSVLDWNKRAIDFYQSIGAKPLSDWTMFRLDEEGIIKLAKKSDVMVFAQPPEKQFKNNNTSILKWLTIGFLGMLSIFAILTMFLFNQISPFILQYDQGTGKIQFGGKTIQIHSEEEEFVGTHKLSPDNVKTIEIDFKNGNFEILPSLTNELHYECKTLGGEVSGPNHESEGRFMLDLTKTLRLNCKIKIPKKIQLILDGSNGKVSLIKPHTDIEVHLKNGNVSIKPDSNKKYQYDLYLNNGHMDDFESSKNKDDPMIQIRIENGIIKNKG